ncbi:MAG: hypothetical protein COX55_05435, partial [Zetaproteobacteria bacterium CG23_combo_of_CG06-09_8_20_14_all_54_7]
MSWFNKIFDKSPDDSHCTQQPVKAVSAQSGQPAQSSHADDTEQETLQLLLARSPQASAGAPVYNLEQPPAICKDVQDHLNARINSIPPMPEIWHEIQAILQQPHSSASDLGQCVARDPILTAKVLAACNSAAYASSNQSEIANIPLAIARLGLQEASSIIFHTLAPDLTGHKNQHQIRHIWFHAQAIAVLSRLLAEPAQIVDRSQASLNGMLHDIGKLVIIHIEPEDKLVQLGSAIHSGVDSLAAEHTVLGYTHIDAGMMLALHWRLPKQIRQFIEQHHDPEQMDIDAIAKPEAAMINHLAHLILQQLVPSSQPHANG